jgi:hypothetical protein
MTSRRQRATWIVVMLVGAALAPVVGTNIIPLTAAATSTTAACPIQPDPPVNTLPNYAQSGTPQPIQYRTAVGSEDPGNPQLQSDGDYHLEMTPTDNSLLSDGSVSSTFLNPEEVPNAPIATGETNYWPPSPYPIVPTSGENIIVRGPWIQDPHGNNWMELHPIFGWCPWSGSNWTADYTDYDNNPAQGVTGISLTPTSWGTGQTLTYSVTILNNGAQSWVSGGTNPVRLNVYFLSSSNTAVSDQAFSLPSDLTPGHAATMSLSVTAPSNGGSYTIEYQMVEEGTSGFAFPNVADVPNVAVSGTTGGTNDFSIAANPASLTLTAGASATTVISTAVTSGSPQSVSLSANGLPAGASAGFNPMSVTSGGKSTMTLTTSVSTPGGTYTVTVTGTGTSAIHRASVTLTVKPVVPTTPGNVTATATSPTSVELTWSASTEAGGTITSYRIARNGSALTTISGSTTDYADNTVKAATTYTYTVTAVGSNGTNSAPGTSNRVTTPSPPPPTTSPPQPVQAPSCPTGVSHQAPGEPWAVAATSVNINGRLCAGYWVVTRSGGVIAIGAAPWMGDMSTQALNAPAIGIAATPGGGGYYLLGGDGGIFSFGNARFFGSTGGIHLNAPVVGMAVTPSGGGYWLTAADGGVFTFGNATFLGSMGATRLNRPVVSMSADPLTGGYWLVAADGGIFTFDAPFFGSMGGQHINQPVVGMSPQPDGGGYRLVASDGGVFDFGDAVFYGSLPGEGVQNPQVTTMANSVDGNGYYLINAAGTVWAFGDAAYLGNA